MGHDHLVNLVMEMFNLVDEGLVFFYTSSFMIMTMVKPVMGVGQRLIRYGHMRSTAPRFP